MPDSQRVALVSGANRGIGLETVRQLAAKRLTVVLTSRDLAAGDAAARKLAAEGLAVVARQLAVTDPASVTRLAAAVEAEFGRLDALVNNAGVYLDQGRQGVDADLDAVRQTLETNLFGAWRLCQAFLPLMRRGGYGRIVNVSSGMGQLNDMGGGSPGYRVSKTALNALTCILADELRGTGILVNAACPGWVRTEMGGREAPRSVEQGADTPVWLATLPDDGPTGGFFRDRKPIPW
jgi:NAD(P)-dependent dehydrogenase (short-subunit alcohol dehydrogenase family)